MNTTISEILFSTDHGDFTREDMIEGLRIVYEELLRRRKIENPEITGFPDFEAMLDHIEAHGIPPKAAPKYEQHSTTVDPSQIL